MPIPWFDTHITQAFKWGWLAPTRGGVGTEGGHSGIDLAEENGTPLTAAVDGTILHAHSHPWGGQVDILYSTFGQPFVLSYLHMSDIAVQDGEHVSQGQYIGASGGAPYSRPYPTASRFSSGPHLHFELTKGDKAPYEDYSPWKPDASNYPLDPTDFWMAISKNGLAGDESFLAGGKHGGLAVAGTHVATPNPSGSADWAHQALVEVPGFAGFALALDRAESLGPYSPNPQGLDNLNPLYGVNYGLTWVHDNGLGLVTRSALILVGLIVLVGVLIALVRKPAVAGLQVAQAAAPLLV